MSVAIAQNFPDSPYNPSTGRFMQKDPIMFNGFDTNLYRYVHNDPINYFDPDGLVERRASGGSGGAPGLNAPGGSSRSGGMYGGSSGGVVPNRPTRLRPDPNASGAHTTFRTNSSGQTTGYQTWRPQTNPKNPASWESVLRFRASGRPHYDKITGQQINPPYIQNTSTGATRPAQQCEIPGVNFGK